MIDRYLFDRGRPSGRGRARFTHFSTSERRQTRPRASRAAGSGKSPRCVQRQAEFTCTPPISAISVMPTSSIGAEVSKTC